MPRPTKPGTLGLICLAGAILACDSSGVNQPTSAPAIATARAPVEEPFVETLVDVNPCTGATVTYTFTGTSRLQTTPTGTILVVKGTASTSDGFTGSFNRQFVVNEHVTHLRFHDTEVSNATGQRIMFAAAVVHETTANGQSIVSFTRFSGLRCVGRP
jgi:hypothetical protein